MPPRKRNINPPRRYEGQTGTPKKKNKKTRHGDVPHSADTPVVAHETQTTSNETNSGSTFTGCGDPPPIQAANQSSISPQIGVGESINNDPLPFVTFNDLDIFITQENKLKIWNGEFVDLTTLLKQNFVATCPGNLSGPLTMQNNNLYVQTAQKKIKQITSIEMWTDAFINFIIVYIQKHSEKMSDILRYLTIIRETATSNPLQKWLSYDEQFRLRMSKDPTKSWANIDGHLWLMCALTGNMVTKEQKSMSCYDFNFKGFCIKTNCFYTHTCIRCNMGHPILTCGQMNTMYPNFQDTQIRNYMYGPSNYANMTPLPTNGQENWQQPVVQVPSQRFAFQQRTPRPQWQNQRPQLQGQQWRNPRFVKQAQQHNFRPRSQGWFMGTR